VADEVVQVPSFSSAWRIPGVITKVHDTTSAATPFACWPSNAVCDWWSNLDSAASAPRFPPHGGQ